MIYNKQNIISTYIEAAKRYFGVVTFLLLILFVIGEVACPDERDTSEIRCQAFEAEWEQVLESDERIPVEIPGKIPAEYGEVVTISTMLPQDLYNYETLCFRSIWQDVTIYIDGEQRVHYSTENSRPFGSNSAVRYIFVELQASDAGKELTYEFTSWAKYTGEVRTIYIGDKSSIWFYIMKNSVVRTIITLLLLLLSLFCIIVCAILRYLYKKHLALNYLAWTLFFCALWTLSETEVRQVFFKNVSVLSNYTYWSLMMIPIPLLIYINDIQKRHYEKMYLVPILYSSVMLIISTVLQVFDVVQFVEQLPFIHAGIIVAIVCAIGTITADAFRKQLSDYLFVGIGIYGLLLSAVIEMCLYYTKSSLTIGTVLSLGLLFLLIMAIIKTGQDFFRSEQKKQEAIMASKAQAQFLASMSHEIRTPINAVIGMNEMILRENQNETIQEYANNIQRSSNMLLGLVNDVLDFSKIESGQIELVEGPYNLGTLLKDEMLMLNARATGKAISTDLEVDETLPTGLQGDELRIKQVLNNLLSNAVKYTKEGNVTLRATFGQVDDDTIMLSFSVIDTGSGIRREELAKLFDSFKRLELNKNRNIEGTGLGLNIAKSLAELMGGSIMVESEYGKGSIFTVSIPQKVLDAKPIGAVDNILHESKKESYAKNHLFTAPNARILIVDDNAMNLSVMKGLLKRTKLQLDFAISGKECLEMTKTNVYDIILMDHMMPELDGIETLHILRKDMTNPNKDTIVIALTANAVAGCREMYLAEGFDDYFAKPIQADKLDALLIEHLPADLVYLDEEKYEKNEEKAESKESNQEVTQDEDVLEINQETGMFYCGCSEELYREILVIFCEQYETHTEQLENYYNQSDWKQYAIIAHALKGNAMNIGATNFSKLSLQHELAGKEENAEFIQREYKKYVDIYRRLVEKINVILKELGNS